MTKSSAYLCFKDYISLLKIQFKDKNSRSRKFEKLYLYYCLASIIRHFFPFLQIQHFASYILSGLGLRTWYNFSISIIWSRIFLPGWTKTIRGIFWDVIIFRFLLNKEMLSRTQVVFRCLTIKSPQNYVRLLTK